MQSPLNVEPHPPWDFLLLSSPYRFARIYPNVHNRIHALSRAKVKEAGRNVSEAEDLVQRAVQRFWVRIRDNEWEWNADEQAAERTVMYCFRLLFYFLMKDDGRQRAGRPLLFPLDDSWANDDQNLVQLCEDDALPEVLPELSTSQREILRLTYVLKLPPEEIAKKMNKTSLAAVSVAQCQARKRVRELLVQRDPRWAKRFLEEEPLPPEENEPEE